MPKKETGTRSVVFTFPSGRKKSLLLPDDWICPSVYQDIISGKSYPRIIDDVDSVRVILDVGANVGLASLYFRDLYPLADIYAWEPVESTYDLLVENTKGAGIVCHNRGWWTEDGPLQMSISEAACNKNSCIGVDDAIKEETCMMVDSASVIQQWDSVDILKLDVEGAELAILNRIASLLDRVALIQLEFHRVSYRMTIDELLKDLFLLVCGRIEAPGFGELSYLNRREVPDHYWKDPFWTCEPPDD